MSQEKQRPQRNEGQYQKYLEDNTWRCDQSTTGAHYWIVAGNMQKCKHCSAEKEIPTEVSFGYYQGSRK